MRGRAILAGHVTEDTQDVHVDGVVWWGIFRKRLAARSSGSIAPQGADWHGEDRRVEPECARSGMEDQAQYEPAADLLAEPSEVFCGVRTGGGVRFHLY